MWQHTVYLLLYPFNRLFDDKYHAKSVLPEIAKSYSNNELEEIFAGAKNDPSFGSHIAIDCAGVRCVFEFLTYKYRVDAGEQRPPPPAGTFHEVEIVPRKTVQ